MDNIIDPTTGDYSGAVTTTLQNAVYLRLMTPRGAWWADTSLGSRLHELQREKDVPRVYRLAQQYAEQALKPLLDDKRASKITVTASRLRPGWLVLTIDVIDATNTPATFTHPVRVS